MFQFFHLTLHVLHLSHLILLEFFRRRRLLLVLLLGTAMASLVTSDLGIYDAAAEPQLSDRHCVAKLPAVACKALRVLEAKDCWVFCVLVGAAR